MNKKTSIERFLDNINKGSHADSCWEWIASKNKGYGQFFANGKNISAHRFSYEYFNGPITNGLHVCHKCDNPGCVNPEHLFIGTPVDNANDKAKKHRASKKLTKRDVVSILDCYRNKGMGQREISRKFCIDQNLVYLIISGEVWRHVSENLGFNFHRPSTRHKLNSVQVIEIREKYKTSCFTQRELAKLYNISVAQINGIINGKICKHV